MDGTVDGIVDGTVDGIYNIRFLIKTAGRTPARITRAAEPKTVRGSGSVCIRGNTGEYWSTTAVGVIEVLQYFKRNVQHCYSV